MKMGWSKEGSRTLHRNRCGLINVYYFFQFKVFFKMILLAQSLSTGQRKTPLIKGYTGGKPF